MNAAGQKLLSLTRISERRPSGRSGPNVIPSTLSSGIPSASRSSSSVFSTALDAAEQRREAVEAVDVVGAGERDVVELDRVPGPGRADRERALHREQELVVQRQQLDEAVDRELVRGHGRLGDRIRPVDVLPVERALLQVVAQQPRRAARRRPSRAGRPGRARSRSPVKRKRPFGGVAALSKPRFWRTPRVPAAFGRNAEGSGSAPSWRPSSPNSRTHGSIRRAAKPSDVITSVSSFVSVSPSGSRLSGANG